MSQTNSSQATVLDIPKFAAESQMPDADSDLNSELNNAAPNSVVPEDEGDFESVADRLMDTLFADVDRMLDREVDLLPEPSLQSSSLQTPDTASSYSAEPQSLAVSPKLSPRPSLLDQAETEGELSDLAELMTEVSEPTPQNRSFDKLLLSLMMVALVAAGGAWFYFRNRLAPAVTVVPPSATQIQSQKDQEFLDYVSRSLDRLERDAKAQRQAATIAAAAPSPSPSPSTVLERVYIPIYQSPVASPTLPAVPQTVPLPQISSLPASPVATAPTTTPNITSAATRVLIGVLELGDRSAALFEIDGAPQRIQIGESIGGSGWTLVSIKNQEAIVRRNGEVRSIYVGQKF